MNTLYPIVGLIMLASVTTPVTIYTIAGDIHRWFRAKRYAKACRTRDVNFEIDSWLLRKEMAEVALKMPDNSAVQLNTLKYLDFDWQNFTCRETGYFHLDTAKYPTLALFRDNPEVYVLVKRGYKVSIEVVVWHKLYEAHTHPMISSLVNRNG